MEKEDGEMSDDNAMLVDDEETFDPKPSLKSEENITLLYKAEKNCLVVQALEKVDASKLEDRAKRFGLNLTGNRVVTQKQIDELYTNFGIGSGNERHFRFDTLHLSGVDGLTTREIFEYLEDYKPVSLEWIDDNSCNLVCQDHITTALALLVHSREIRNEELKNMLAKTSTYHWREGMPHEKQDVILMRFATNSDKKDSSKKRDIKPKLTKNQTIDECLDSISKNPWGDLCQSWGVYDQQEILIRPLSSDKDDEHYKPTKIVQIKNKSLAKRLGKRRYTSESDVSSNNSSDDEWKRKPKGPRMRMHADDEESRQKTRPSSPVPDEEDDKDSFAPLSIEVVNTSAGYTPKQMTILSDKFKRHSKSEAGLQSRLANSIRSRLGEKVAPSDDDWSSDTSEKSDHYVMSRVQKMGKKKSDSSIWSRIEIPSEDSSKRNDLRQKLKPRKPSTKTSVRSNDLRDSTKTSTRSNDLRDRIGFGKGVSLRVEIDNDYHNESD